MLERLISHISGWSRRRKIIVGVLAGIIVLGIVGTVLPQSEPTLPVPTPIPDAAPTVVTIPTTPGLKVTRADIENIFALPQWGGFTFESSPRPDGTPRTLGKSQDGATRLELTGSDDELTEIRLTAVLSSDPETNALYFNTLLAATVQEWSGWSEWLNEGLRSRGASTAQDDNKFILVVAEKRELGTADRSRLDNQVLD